jgi:hypothetical protein
MAITPLNFWVQPVIPLTFDDSISYLETLGKVVEKLNESLTQSEDWAAELRKDITDFTTAINQEMATFQGNVQQDIATFESRITTRVQKFETDMTKKYNDFAAEITSLIKTIQLHQDFSIDHDSPNMWDVWGSGAKLNYRLNTTNGLEVYDNDSYISAYIPVIPTKRYAICFGKERGTTEYDPNQYIIIYDSDKNFVKKADMGTISTYAEVFTMPANGYYIRIRVDLASDASTIPTPAKISISDLTEKTGMVDAEIISNYNTWLSHPESFKTTISSTTTDDNAVYKRKITWRDMDDSKNLALYDNITVGGYTTGAYNITTGKFSSSITNSFTSDFIPVCPAVDDIVITNPLNAGNYANVIYFNENKETIGMYKFPIQTSAVGIYINPILYNDVAYIKFSALTTDLHNCRVTADGVPKFGSGDYPDTVGFNNVILVTHSAGGIIKRGTKTYAGNECYKILKDCITNDRPIYDSETVSGQLIILRATVCKRTGENETTCRFIGNKLTGDPVTLVVSLFDDGSIALL